MRNLIKVSILTLLLPCMTFAAATSKYTPPSVPDDEVIQMIFADQWISQENEPFFHLFIAVKKYLQREKNMIKDADQLYAFMQNLSRHSPFSEIGFTAVVGHMHEQLRFLAGSAYGNRDLVLEIIRKYQIYSQHEAEYVAIGGQKDNPLQSANVRKLSPQNPHGLTLRLSSEDKVFKPNNGPIERYARHFVHVMKDGQEIQKLAIPAGDDYAYPQILSLPFRDEPTVQLYSLGNRSLLVTQNEDGIVSIWSSSANGIADWSLVATMKPALNLETFYPNLQRLNKDPMAAFLSLSELHLAQGADGSLYAIAYGSEGQYRASLWKMYKLKIAQ